MKIEANLVNIIDETIQYCSLEIINQKIYSITILGEEKIDTSYILPGFIDAHVHIESSMLTPVQFARMAVVHGTVGTVSDPHEIANILGLEGVLYMIDDAERVPFKFCFGAPSCVPATNFETAGAEITPKEIAKLLAKKEIGYLAEMMNFPGVINNDTDIHEKLKLARAYNKPIDGHAPGLRGAALKKYIDAGISTDHECFTLEEAEEKLKLGMKVLIREGSAAKNFDALIPLASAYADYMMFCSDDKHPDSLEEGHINQLVKRAIEAGMDTFAVLRMASLNPIDHYQLDVGLLREGDPADFIEIDNLIDFTVLKTYINGECVAANGQSLIPDLQSEIVNNFNCNPIKTKQLEINKNEFNDTIHVIEAIDGQLITNHFTTKPFVVNQKIVSNIEKDILKIVVVNRYQDSTPSVAFIHAFGLKEGAIAASVAHDSHNIIAVGVDDESIAEAVNLIIQHKGGLSAVSNTQKGILPLPIAGLMTSEDGYKISQDYKDIDTFAKKTLGCTLASPFMTLSFMALLVIPKLKLSDLGLFNGEIFEFV